MTTQEPDTDHRLTFEIEGIDDPMVDIKGLKKYFPVTKGILGRKVDDVKAVDDVSFQIPEGQTLGLVGESGCGKTTTGRSMLRITEPTAGEILIDGTDITSLSKRELRGFRKEIQMVYQDATSSLNPKKTTLDIIAEPLRIHSIGDEKQRVERVHELLELVNLPPEEFQYRYPNTLSGGQKQRVAIARAISLNPKVLVLDEPTSALDVSVQAQVIDLLEELQDQLNLTYLFITHNLALVRNIADWIGTMYLGKIMEIGPVEKIFQSPQNPYTRALLSAIHTVSEEDKHVKPPEIILEGDIPDPRERQNGCVFAGRCPEAFDTCKREIPRLYSTGKDHYARCLLHDTEFKHQQPLWMSSTTDPQIDS